MHTQTNIFPENGLSKADIIFSEIFLRVHLEKKIEKLSKFLPNFFEKLHKQGPIGRANLLTGVSGKLRV